MSHQGDAEHAAGVRRLNAAGQGFQDAWGAKPIGLTDEDQSNLRKAGVFNDYEAGHESLMKSFNEAVIRPAASAIDVGLRLPSALLAGAGAAETQTAQDAAQQGGPLSGVSSFAHGATGELLSGAAEGAFMGEVGGQPIGMHGPSPAVVAADDATAARSVGVLGEGDAGFYDATPLTPENAQARTQASAEVGEPPPIAPPPPPDVHSLARRIDPDTFEEYDALNAESAIHRATIQRLGVERENSPEAVAAQGDIDTILGRVNGVESRLTKVAAARLEDAQGRLDAATSLDNPEMTAARDSLMEADFRMRELAPDVSAAYRYAREIAPTLPEDAALAEGAKPAGEEAPKGGEEPEGKEGAPAAPEGEETPAPGQVAQAGAAAEASSPEGQAAVAPPNVLAAEALGKTPPAESAEAPSAAPEEAGAAINPRAIGNPRAVQGTGETVTRGLSREVEASAVENELTSSFGELPEYQRLNMKEQAGKAIAFMDKDYEAAKAVAMGRRQPPADLHPASVAVAVEKRATAEGDVETLRQLATSPLATRVTTAAQTIRILGERDKGSPLAAITELQQAREAYVAKTVDIPAEKTKIAAEIKAEVRAGASKPDAWKSFIRDLTCKE